MLVIYINMCKKDVKWLFSCFWWLWPSPPFKVDIFRLPQVSPCVY